MPSIAKTQDIDSLREECRIITRHLVGQSPPEEMELRYVEGNAVIPADSFSHEDVAVAAFAFRHPWTLPCLDAALGLIGPHSLLRSKLLLMTAILEASPHYCDAFLPKKVSAFRFAADMVRYGVSDVVKAVAGFICYRIAIRG